MSNDQDNPVLYGHEYVALKAMIESMLAAEKKATEKPWNVARQGRNTPDGWVEWLDVWGPDGEPLIGCDENPMEWRNVRNAENDAAFTVIARNNFERVARMALRFAKRAEALEYAVGVFAGGGFKDESVAAWLAKNGWTLDDGYSPPYGCWRRGDNTFDIYFDGSMTMRNVRYLAETHGCSLADVLEEIMAEESK